ncbi:MAG: hypothetical protein ABIF19_13105 [Planctomycetota bacterium]
MLRHILFERQFSIIVMVLAITMLVGTESAFTAQDVRVGFVPGRGDDAALEEQAFAAAGIEFQRIGTGDYRLDRLLEFDVIGVGVVAYDSNTDLKANFNVLKEYVQNGGYLVTLDFQQDSTWNPNFLPHPLSLLDPDVDDDVGVILADHNIFKQPNTITEGHFGPGVWGAGDFMADGPHAAAPPWQPLVTDRQNQWPLVVGAAAGKGYVVFSSLQTLQSLGRSGAQEVAEVLQNFVLWRGPLGGRVKAFGPTPANGAMNLDTWVNLTWLPGDFAVSHDVYLGDNFDDVNDGTPDSPVFRGNQTSTMFMAGFPGFAYPDGLVPGTTYYWRIDEINEAEPNSPWKGDVWSFYLPPKTAYNPDPADGAEFVDLDATFTWTPGYGAKLHTVHIGTNFDDVNNAAGGAPQGPATYKPSLELEKVYYWRVDEFDAVATHKGDIWGFTTPGAAGSLQPANGATDVQINATLNWTPATTATSHDVYFGTDADAVQNATTASPEYKGNKAAGAESHDPGKLVWHSDYYWRVDAVYSTGAVKGLVWSFMTADFLLVDDFESYNDIDPPDAASNRIFDKWIDGFGTTTNGALVGNDLPPYAEQTVVHGGVQSMPYFYDNNLKTSEAALTLVWPRDWTEEGVAKLSLWFRGDPANAADRMCVALNGNAVVYHDDPAVTQKAGWTRWVIDLQAFADQGVNLANVNTITIGLGTRNSPAAGGSGQMYFDDIRLYR